MRLTSLLLVVGFLISSAPGVHGFGACDRPTSCQSPRGTSSSAIRPTTGAEILPDVAPSPDDPVVTSRADKFFNTDLDQILEAHAIQTLVLVGAAANGAVETASGDTHQWRHDHVRASE